MPLFTSFLYKNDLELWQLYLEKLRLGLKKEANQLLNDFISALENYSEVNLDQIVLALCEHRKSDNLPVNHLLFKEIIYTNLIQNSLQLKPDYHYLLATFEQHIYSDQRLNKDISAMLNLDEKWFDSLEVLERELHIGLHLKAAKLLINKLARQLDYALHELPIGLLYEEKYINKLLRRMEELLGEYNLMDASWQERIRFVKTVLVCWKDFGSSSGFQNFEDYLVQTDNEDARLILAWDKALYNFNEDY